MRAAQSAELEEMGIADDLFEADGSLDGWQDARKDMVKSGWFTGHLFRCLHCGRYHLSLPSRLFVHHVPLHAAQ